MELSLRLDTLGLVEMQYLRGRERYRDWPPFQLLAASRQARVFAYLTREAAEQLHQQILTIEAAIGMDIEDEEEAEEKRPVEEEVESRESLKPSERETTTFSPAFAQALKQLNELARQRLGDSNIGSSQVVGAETSESEEEDALEQLQDAFAQMMEVVRELAEEMSTDALKITGRFKCARTNIEFIPRASSVDDEDDGDDEDDEDEQSEEARGGENGLLNIEVELVMMLQLYEEGHTRQDDLPAVELQLDVDDFERLHETLDFALERERRSRRRR
ncbi:MAG: hypothetical protein IMW89_18140 [Ktedonobacteraceae bacterium]|nr:hypothetical protein [Ktedonobacteraceae bacterium]